MLQSTTLNQNIKFVEAGRNIVCGQADSWGKALGTHLPRVQSSRTGWMCLAVPGKGGVKCRVSSGSVSPCFCRVSALSTYVLVDRLVTWHGKLSVGNAVSVQTVLVIRAWSRTVCVVLFYTIALGIK